MDDRAFRDLVKQRYGVQPEYLTREQASVLIGSFNSNGSAAPRQVA